MPERRAQHTIDAGGLCDFCEQRHVTRFGGISCSGHKRYDSSSYTPGQPRKPLDKPQPCTNPPSRGGVRCRYHGNTAASQQRNARLEQERKAAKVLRRFGEQIDTTPTDALLDAVKWTAGYVQWLRDKVASTDADKTTMDGVDEDRVPLLNEERALTQLSNVTGKREASVWVDLLGQWHDRLVRICSEAIRAGIEERRVRIAEQQGALVADVIRKILDDLNLTPEQAAAAGESVPRNLRLLAS